MNALNAMTRKTSVTRWESRVGGLEDIRRNDYAFFKLMGHHPGTTARLLVYELKTTLQDVEVHEEMAVGA